ncbi:MAG: hypothetical protein K9J21_07135 [Bacteroidales bacterium]|nr:hypothetical protein [Bacteroidales bacterium]
MKTQELLDTIVDNQMFAEEIKGGILLEPKSHDARNRLISAFETDHIHYSLKNRNDILILNTNEGLCSFLKILIL